jgi:hypothetical protein
MTLLVGIPAGIGPAFARSRGVLAGVVDTVMGLRPVLVGFSSLLTSVFRANAGLARVRQRRIA